MIKLVKILSNNQAKLKMNFPSVSPLPLTLAFLIWHQSNWKTNKRREMLKDSATKTRLNLPNNRRKFVNKKICNI